MESVNADGSKKENDTIEIDLKKLLPYLLIIIPIAITILVRAQTLNLAAADEWAAGNVYGAYRNQIYSQVKGQYPSLPEENLNRIVDEQFAAFAKQNSQQLEQQVKDVAQQYKDQFQYKSGDTSYPYIGDIDSYYWLRQARNIAEKGHNCDAIEEGVCYDTYTLAPLKLRLPKSMHPYAIATLYKIVKPFNRDFTLMQSQLIVPTVFAVLIAALVFLVMLWISGPLGAVFSSVIISVNPMFLSRSLGSDSDIYNIFFPVLVFFLIYLTFSSKNIKSKAVYSAFAGLSIGAYSFAWVGWWYIFDFILVAILADYGIKAAVEAYRGKKLDFRRLLKDERTKEFAAALLPFLIVSFISIALISGPLTFVASYTSPFAFTKVKVAANTNMWPNVLNTVAEFNESSVGELIGSMGGRWLFFFALVGTVFLVFRSTKGAFRNLALFLPSIAILYFLTTQQGMNMAPRNHILLMMVPLVLCTVYWAKSGYESDIRLAIILFLWMGSSVYAATKGVRFIMLVLPPIAIGIGSSFGFFHKSLSAVISKTLKVRKIFVGIIIFLLLSYFLVAPVKAGNETAKRYFPNVNDQWWSVLTKIKDNSKPDAIINSWWDFGHWFKYIADRRVTLDGSSQNNPQLHWLGKTLLTGNEDEAVGILRMLDCGGNQAFNTINKIKNSTPKSIKLLEKIMLIRERERAKEALLEDGMTSMQAEDTLQYTHCEAPEDFFITSEDMIGKAGVWAHFGSWDFDRAWMEATFKRAENREEAVSLYINELNLTREQAESYYSQIQGLKSESEINAWISPWPGYVQDSRCTRQDNIVRCPLQQGFVDVNLSSMDAYIPSSPPKRPDVFAYVKEDRSIVSKPYAKDKIGVGMLLIARKDGSYSSLFMSPQLVDSMFTRMYYLEGHGLHHFEPFDLSGKGSFEIKVWKVDWQGKEEPNINPELANP